VPSSATRSEAAARRLSITRLAGGAHAATPAADVIAGFERAAYNDAIGLTAERNRNVLYALDRREQMLVGAGLSTVTWMESPNRYFALMLAAPSR